MPNDLPIYLANKSIRHLNLCEPESKSICKCEVCARLLASHAFVSHVHHVPYMLTCLRALCAYFPSVPAYLRAFGFFYMPHVISFFMCVTRFHFLRALRGFHFSLDLLAFIFLCAIFFLCALGAFIFLRVVRALIFLRAFISLRALHTFIFYVPHISTSLTCLRVLRAHMPYAFIFLRAYLPSYFYVLMFLHFFTCLTCLHLFKCLHFFIFIMCLHFFTCLHFIGLPKRGPVNLGLSY